MEYTGKYLSNTQCPYTQYLDTHYSVSTHTTALTHRLTQPIKKHSGSELETFSISQEYNLIVKSPDKYQAG